MNTERQMTLEAPSIYQPIMLSILEITSMTEMEKVFTIELPFPMSLEHKPGQFVQVSVLGVGEAPISISSSPSRSKSSFELCVRRAGALTNALHALSPGDVVGVRGPFGRGFPIERFRGKDLLFAPGGLGLAPLRSVINEYGGVDDARLGRIYHNTFYNCRKAITLAENPYMVDRADRQCDRMAATCGSATF